MAPVKAQELLLPWQRQPREALLTSAGCWGWQDYQGSLGGEPQGTEWGLSHSCPQLATGMAPGGLAGWLDLLLWWLRLRSACSSCDMAGKKHLRRHAHFCLFLFGLVMLTETLPSALPEKLKC